MPRNASGVYTTPSNTAAVSGDPVDSAKFNALIADLEADLNVDRPVAAGGTGASDEGGARTNLLVDSKAVEKSAAYTALTTDRSKLIRSTAAMTLSLTAAATLGDGWFVDVLASTGALTIDPNGSETIDGSATLAVAEGQSARIRCDGTSFYSQFSTSAGGSSDVVDDTSPQLGGALDTNGNAIDFSQGADVASATELLLLRDGNIFNITGTTTITSIETTADAWPVGSVAIFRASGVFTLTHHATNLILTGEANITTAAGDTFALQKYASGDWRMLWYNKIDGTALVGGNQGVMVIQDEKANGTNAQGLTASTWVTRDLNTVTENSITGASLSSNEITLPTGTYKLSANVPAFQVNGNVTRLYNVTDSSVIQQGQVANSHQGGYATSLSFIEAYFTLAAEKDISIEHLVQTTNVSGGGDGRSLTGNSDEHIFTQVKIEKVA